MSKQWQPGERVKIVGPVGDGIFQSDIGIEAEVVGRFEPPIPLWESTRKLNVTIQFSNGDMLNVHDDELGPV